MKPLFKTLFFIMLIISSCKKDEIKIDPNNLLIGTWNYSDYQDNAMVYIRSGKFIDNRGYKFNSDGTVVERTFAGWCATPPVSYSNYQGTWSILNDTLIQTAITYYDGLRPYRLAIKLVDSKSLKLTFVSDK